MFIFHTFPLLNTASDASSSFFICVFVDILCPRANSTEGCACRLSWDTDCSLLGCVGHMEGCRVVSAVLGFLESLYKLDSSGILCSQILFIDHSIIFFIGKIQLQLGGTMRKFCKIVNLTSSLVQFRVVCRATEIREHWSGPWKDGTQSLTHWPNYQGLLEITNYEHEIHCPCELPVSEMFLFCFICHSTFRYIAVQFQSFLPHRRGD